jgi:hypothetical protein
MLHDQRIALDDVGVRRPSLDEVFLALTGQPLGPSDNDHDGHDGDHDHDQRDGNTAAA